MASDLRVVERKIMPPYIQTGDGYRDGFFSKCLELMNEWKDAMSIAQKAISSGSPNVMVKTLIGNAESKRGLYISFIDGNDGNGFTEAGKARKGYQIYCTRFRDNLGDFVRFLSDDFPMTGASIDDESHGLREV